jgi:hypothetical protein
VPLDPLESGPLDTFLILSSATFPSEAIQRGPHVRALGMTLQVMSLSRGQLGVTELLLRQRRAEIVADHRGHCPTKRVGGDPPEIFGQRRPEVRRTLANDIQPRSRLANTGPVGPVSPSSAVNASTPKRGNTTVCAGASPEGPTARAAAAHFLRTESGEHCYNALHAWLIRELH